MDHLLAQTLASDFGNPVSSDTGYAVCLYDEDDALAGSVVVDRGGAPCGGAPCWRSVGTAGFKYRDGAGTSSGVHRLVLRSGPAGQGKIRVSARDVTAPLPTGIAGRMAGSHRATVQLRTSEGVCFGAELPVIGQADVGYFKGLLP
jgi:hypothetical protein